MTQQHPRFYAEELAAAAQEDFRALENRRAEVDASLSRMSADERIEFKSQLSRLLKRNEITKSKPNFKRSWSGAKN